MKQELLEEQDQTIKKAKAAGIHFLQSSEMDREQASVDRGVVVAIGPTAFKDFGVSECPIAIGQSIAFARYSGKTIKDPYTEESFILLNDEDILVTFKEEAQ